MKTKLIGITGLARSGKDSFALILGRHGYHRIAFADALKKATAKIANEDSHLFFDDFAKEQFSEALGMTRRIALQRVGQAVRESLGKDTWVNRALRQWESLDRPATVISDCRYENEALAIRKLGGIIVRMVRPGAGLTGEAAGHASEVQLPDGLVDVEINNDGTLGELVDEARKIALLLEHKA